MNDFDEQLAFSHKAADWHGWIDLYQSFFGANLKPDESLTFIDHRQDGWHQRAGVDRSIVFPDSRQVLIDEKARGRNKITGKVYEDIALEFWSDVDRKKPGWIATSKACDYIAYAILPLGVCYLLPFIQLRQVWAKHRKQWIDAHGTRNAKNRSWTTVFCPVPASEVLARINESWSLTFEPFECLDE